MKVALLTTESRDFYKDYNASQPFFSTSVEALLQGFVRIPDVEVHLISCVHARMVAPEKLAPNLYYHQLYISKWGWMRTAYLGCIRAVRKTLRKIAPDIVHGQGTEREGALAAALSGYPSVVTIHGIMAEMAGVLHARPGSFHWLASLLETIALRKTAGVFCNSHFTDDKIRDRCRKTWLVPNAVREPFFAKPQTGHSSVPPVPPVLLNVGTICSYKRQNELLDLFEELHREGAHFKAQFLGTAANGDGYAARFLERVKKSPFASYDGFKKGAELIACYDGASAIVHVSTVETFGLGVAEALSRNLKLLAFNVGGVPDVASGADRVDLVADGDWAGLKNAIRVWLQAGAPRAVSASEAMRKKYHPEIVARRHLEIYREVLQTAR